jgi:outer membrane receptor protein involved in Fe transport
MINRKYSLFFVLFSVTFHSLSAQADSIPKVIELSAVRVSASAKELSIVENLPVAGTVLSDGKLSTGNIVSTAELTAVVPNLFMPDYGSRLTSPVYIRGIGSRINSPSVGLYADNIPYFEKSMYKIDLDDVKRVEVLRGPQATLYGRNTMGGVINLYSYSPFDRRGTRVKLSGATYNAFSAKISHNALITEKFALSVSAGYNREGGYFKNITSNEYAGKLNEADASIRLEYRPNRLWKIAYAGTFGDSKQKGYPYAPIDPESSRTGAVAYNQESGYNQRQTTQGISIQRESDKTLFTSITSFQHLKDKQWLDQDFTADSIYFATQRQQHYMLSQELVLRSKQENARYRWSAGAFGFRQRAKSGIDVDNYVQKAAEYRITDMETFGAALYHQSKINDVFVENLSLEAGLRIDAERSNMDYDYSMAMNGNVRENPRVSSKLDFVEFLPRVSAMYKYSDNLWFASVSRGYKTGGFNTAFELDSDKSFKPEYSVNYEIGYRSKRMFNDMFRIDLSLFYIDWRDQHIYAVNPSGQGSVLRNAGKSHSTGFEASLSLSPVKNLSFDLEYGYTYAVFDENVKSADEDFSGNHIPYVPRNTLSLIGLYRVNLPKALNRITFMAQYKGAGKLYWDETNLSKQDFYGVVNMRAEFLFVSKYKLALWTKNLFDAYYNSFDFKVGASRFGQQGVPRTLGASLSLMF